MSEIKFKPGQKVATLQDPDELGVVRSVDEEDNVVWVEFPTRLGVDVVDVDPADLVLVNNFVEAPERVRRYVDDVEQP